MMAGGLVQWDGGSEWKVDGFHTTCADNTDLDWAGHDSQFTPSGPQFTMEFSFVVFGFKRKSKADQEPIFSTSPFSRFLVARS
jgi:hypothetical protein